MRNIVIGILVFAVLLIFIVKAAVPSYDTVVRRRVTTILTGMKDGSETSARAESAMAMWAVGKFRIADNATLSWASDHFDKWRLEKNLYRKTGDFSIDSVEIVPNEPVDTALVTFVLEGKQYKIKVPKDHAITWAQ